MVTLNEIQAAREKLKGIASVTPMVKSYPLSSPNQNVYLKLENLQRTGSFKLRGAYNKIASLSESERLQGVIASSAGNHAQGVALSARLFGSAAVICMPAGAPLAKVNNTRGYGAEVVLHGSVYDEAYAKARELQRERGLTFIHPFDDEAVIAGQGTIALELLEQLPEIDLLVAPIGGGGLLAGLAIAAKAIKPSIKIIGVEAAGAACMAASFKSGSVCSLDKAATIADGIAVKCPGEKTYSILCKLLDDIVTVEEDEIAQAILFLAERSQTIAEGAGAVATAALLSGKLPSEAKNIALMVSGGNIDVNMIARIIDRALLKQGRRFAFSVCLNDAVGQLQNLTASLAAAKANVYSINQTRMRPDVGLGRQNVEAVVETFGEEHKNKIIERLVYDGFVVKPK